MRRPALALLLGCLLLVAAVSALDGYDYYQTIEYAGCDQETYQQDIVIHRTTGTAYNETSGGLETWHIYVGDHCREDYGDIRFTNSTGAELAYYLWPDYDAESARFAVRLEGATTAGTLAVWYGNSTATTTSDGAATYFLFDHFDGSAIDTETWEILQNNGISVSNGALHISSGTGDNAEIFSVPSLPSNVHLQFRIQTRTYYTSIGMGNKDKTGTGSSIGLTYYTNYESAIYSGPSAYDKWIPPRSMAASSTDGDVIPSPPTGYYTEEFVIPEGGKLKQRRNGGAWTTSTRYNGVAGPKPLSIFHYRGYGPMDLDWILVRAYTATPPAALTFSGERETASPPFTVLQPFPGCSSNPTDPDSDGLYEDINGNARWDFQDITLFFQHLVWCEANQPVSLFDWNSNGRCDFDDVFRLWSNGGMI